MENSDKKILVIEDDTFLLDILIKNLTKAGFLVVCAEDGEKGLAKALEIHPNLILLDILLPAMNGMDVLKNLRQDPWGKTAHVIILSNISSPANISESIKYSADDYLVKADFDLKSLMEKIKKGLEK